MINRAVIVGRITKDPELRKTQSNKSVMRFTLACDRRGENAGADYINCIAWNQAADFLAKYAHKGDPIGVDGHITTGSYEGQNGKVYTTDVTAESVRLLTSRSSSQSGNNVSEDQNDFRDTESIDIKSDDLPFY